MLNIIISVKDIQKISYGLYIRLCTLNKFNITRELTGTMLSGEMHVNYLSLITFGEVSYNNNIINANYVDQNK